MDKVGQYTSTADGNDEFTEGNPSGGVPATTVPDDWLNAVQRELVEAITQMGLSLDTADDTLLWQSIQAIYGKTYAGDPNDNVAAAVLRERCWDTSGTLPVMYIATAADGTIGGTTWKTLRDIVDTYQRGEVDNFLIARNGLINGAFIVNQRGVATGTALSLADGEYFFDRWRSVGSTSGIQVASDGAVTLGANEAIEQVIEYGFAVSGETLTVSVADPSADLTITLADYSNTDTASGTISAGSGRQSVTITVPALDSDGHLIFRIKDASGGGASFSEPQVEHGEVATPFERRPTQEELALCQRYYARLGDEFVGGWGASSVPRLHATLPQTMRTSPSLALLDTSIELEEPGATNATSSGATIDGSTVTAQFVRVLLGGFGTATTDGNVAVSINNSDWLEADAEL